MTSGLFIGLYRNQQDGQAGVDFSGRGKNILFVIAKPDVHKAFVPSCRARGFGGRVWDPGFWRRMFWAWKRGGGGGGACLPTATTEFASSHKELCPEYGTA